MGGGDFPQRVPFPRPVPPLADRPDSAGCTRSSLPPPRRGGKRSCTSGPLCCSAAARAGLACARTGASARLHLAAVLEHSHVTGGAFNAQDTSCLIIHFQGSRPQSVLEARALHEGLQPAAGFGLAVGARLLPHEPVDVRATDFDGRGEGVGINLRYNFRIRLFARQTQTRSRLRWNAGACMSSATTSFNSTRASSGCFLAR